MALQSTTKIRLFVFSQKEEEVLSFLQEKEVLEVVAVKGEKRTDVSHFAEFSAAKIDFAIRYLSSFAPQKKGLRNMVLGQKLELSEKEAHEKISGFDWSEVVEKVSALESAKNDIVRGIDESKTALRALEAFEGVEETATEGEFSSSFFVLPVKGAAAFQSQVEGLSDYLDISEVSRSETSVSFVLFARDAEKKSVILLLSQLKGSEIELEQGVSPAQKILGLHEKISLLSQEKEENTRLTQELSVNVDALKVCYDKFSSEKEVNAARRGVQKGDFVSVLEGWVVSQELEGLKKSLSGTFGAVEIEEIEKEAKEKSPVLLKNNKVIEPFEVVTNMYGTPGENEIDPTPFLAPFFVVFFGLCLTDAAYGLMLTLAMGAILSVRLPLEYGVKKMITLLFYAGVSTTAFGVLFGGWFGIDPNSDIVPSALTYVANTNTGELMFLGQVVNPAADLVSKIAPLVLLGGVIHLLLGVLLKGVVAWKNGNKWDTLMVSIPTIVTIVSGVLLAVSASEIAFVEQGEVLKNIVVAAFVVMTVGIMKSGGPITWFMDVTGWLSNTLSYARLFALGLATGVVAQVFNTVAFTIGGMMPTGIDILVIVFVLLFGHTLNIALNLLGAFVHSGRLQFVEFFGQFLGGGGRYFSPLKKVNQFMHRA